MFFLTKRAVLNKSWKKQPTTHQLYVHLHPISQTILESQLKQCFFLIQLAVLNKSWKKQPTTHQLYVHLHPISQTILESQRRHVFFNTACCFKQILEEAANNTPTVRPLTSYLTNHPGMSTNTCFFEHSVLFWTNPGRSSQQHTNCTSTYILSHKPSWKVNEDMFFEHSLLFWTNPERSSQRHNNCTSTYILSHKPSWKVNEDMFFFNTACCSEQILKEVANNTPTVRPLTSYLTNHPGNSTKTCFFEHSLLFRTNPERSSQQHTNCTSTYILSHKPSWKVNEDMFFSTQLAVLNKSWKKQPTTHQLYVHLHPISQTILESQRRHVFFNTACCFEQILEEADNNTPTVRPLTSYLTNHPGKSTKTCFFEYSLLFWTNPERSSQQHTNCTSTYILSHKPSWKLN